MQINTDALKNAEKYSDAMFNEISEEQLVDNLNTGANANATPPTGANANEESHDSEYNDPNPPHQPTDPNPNKPNMGFLDSGVAIGVIDSVLPALFVWGISMTMDKKAKPQMFQLTAQEKKTLEPIVSKCLETITIDLNNPWKALAIVGGMIYGGKFFMIDIDALPSKEVKNEDVEPRKETRGRPRKTI